MHILTADEMREMDRQTIETFGLPGRVLMENAGRGAARVLIKKFPDVYCQRVAIAAGRGNNGGDGLVVARHLHQLGLPVRAVLLGERSHGKGVVQTTKNFTFLLALKVAFQLPRFLFAWKR